MPGKALFFLAGGVGIAAGAPFTTFHYPIITSGVPPVLANGRLAQLADAGQSIIAPAPLAPTAFVLGDTAVAGANADRAVLIGRNLTTGNSGVSSGEDDILIGNGIQVPAGNINTQGLIAIGANITFVPVGIHNEYGNAVVIGLNAIMQNTAVSNVENVVCIGANSRVIGGATVAVGPGAQCQRNEAVAIGSVAIANNGGVAVGRGAGAPSNETIAVGRNASAGLLAGTGFSVAVGARSVAWADYSIVLGPLNANTGVATILIGTGITSAVANRCIIGGVAPNGITDFFFGNDVQDAPGAVTFTFNYTKLSGGANGQGNSLLIRGGGGSGNWPNAENRGIDIQLGLVQAAGATLQPPTSVLAMRHSDLNVALWGGLGATFQGGTKVLFIGNSTAAPVGAPTAGVILYVVAGQLFGMGASGVATGPIVL